MSDKHLLISAAGTGGHVMPGLAVAREMRRRGWTVSWIGTQTGMEGDLVAKDGIEFTGLDFKGVRGKGLKGLVSGIVKLFLATRKASDIIGRMKPDVLFTTGGYIAVPVCKGAKKTGTKIVLMNCDADILMSSKIVMNQASAVACGFAGSARSLAGEKGKITGNPVRAEIEALESPQERLSGRTGKLKILVFGGSLGAQVLNETLPKALALFDEDSRPEVVHQTGVKNVQAVRALYEKAGELYYAIYMPTPGAFDKNITTVYDNQGEICLKYGGLMPPARRKAVEQFFEGATDKGVIWECRLREANQSQPQR